MLLMCVTRDERKFVFCALHDDDDDDDRVFPGILFVVKTQGFENSNISDLGFSLLSNEHSVKHKINMYICSLKKYVYYKP